MEKKRSMNQKMLLLDAVMIESTFLDAAKREYPEKTTMSFSCSLFINIARLSGFKATDSAIRTHVIHPSLRGDVRDSMNKFDS